MRQQRRPARPAFTPSPCSCYLRATATFPHPQNLGRPRRTAYVTSWSQYKPLRCLVEQKSREGRSAGAKCGQNKGLCLVAYSSAQENTPCYVHSPQPDQYERDFVPGESNPTSSQHCTAGQLWQAVSLATRGVNTHQAHGKVPYSVQFPHALYEQMSGSALSSI